MITIGTTKVQQTKGGLGIRYEQILSSNYGANQYGEIQGTVIGYRTWITIQTNILTEQQAFDILEAISNTTGFYISYKDPRKKKVLTKLFVSDGDISFSYNCQSKGQFTNTTLTFKSKEAQL